MIPPSCFFKSTTTRRRLFHRLLRRDNLFTGFHIRKNTNLIIRFFYRLRNALNPVRNRGNNLTILPITTGKFTRLFNNTNRVRRVIRSLRRRAGTRNVILRLLTLNLVNLDDNDARLGDDVSRHANLIPIGRPRLLFDNDRYLMFRIGLLPMGRTVTTHADTRNPYNPRASGKQD